jgi:hypothetical protein
MTSALEIENSEMALTGRDFIFYNTIEKPYMKILVVGATGKTGQKLLAHL